MQTELADQTTPIAQRAAWWQVEENSIHQVIDEERHGHARSLFYVWFAANLSISTLITGALAVFVGNNLLWAMVAVVLGNMVGSVFMAAHSAQGPVLGVPQLIQSRGQFGFFGALLPVVLAILVYVGFWAFGAIPAAQSLTEISSGISTTEGVLIVGIPSLILAVLGYGPIHRAQQITTYLSLLGLGLLSFDIVRHGGLDWSTAGFSFGPFMLAATIVAVYQISFSPYVSDYSRYLPADVGYHPPFWASYVGTAVGAIWVMGMGVLVTAQFPTLGTVQAVSAVSGSGSTLILLTLALTIIGINGMNLYGGMLSILTGTSAFRSVGRSVTLRVIGILATFAVALYLALAASASFLTSFTNFLLLLVYVFVPWTAINLTDFYIVRRGRYDVPAFFDRNGRYARDPANRTYAGFNLNATIAYVAGILVELPFINTTQWKGWAVDSLNGADISWIFGLAVPAVLYLLLTRGAATSSELTEHR